MHAGNGCCDERSISSQYLLHNLHCTFYNVPTVPPVPLEKANRVTVHYLGREYVLMMFDDLILPTASGGWWTQGIVNSKR